jgi:hypothetical protein
MRGSTSASICWPRSEPPDRRGTFPTRVSRNGRQAFRTTGEVGVGRVVTEPLVDHGLADSEVVEVLEVRGVEPQRAMQRVVEVAADAGALHAGGLGFPVTLAISPAKWHQEAAT